MDDLPGERVLKKFRVCREGQTLDGRNISEQEILDMADTYDPVEYTARINCEHMSTWWGGVDASEPLGDVVALEAKQEEFTVNNQKISLMSLYATLSALPKLVQANKEGKKLFASIEFYRKFADTDRAYMVGLAVTDTPASRGTEPLKFSTTKPDTEFSEPKEFTVMSKQQSTQSETTPVEIETAGIQAPASESEKVEATTEKEAGFLQKMSAMLKPKKDEKEVFTEQEKDVVLEMFTKLGSQIDNLTAQNTELETKLNTVTAELDALKNQLSITDVSTQIPPSTGLGNSELTDV